MNIKKTIYKLLSKVVFKVFTKKQKSISLMKKHLEEDFKVLNYPTEIN